MTDDLRSFARRHARMVEFLFSDLRPRIRRDARASDVNEIDIEKNKVLADVGDDAWQVQGEIHSLRCDCSRRLGCEHIGSVLLALSNLGSTAPVARNESPEPSPEHRRILEGARAWATRLRGPSSDTADETSRVVFVLFTTATSSARLAIARQRRSTDAGEWSPPRLLSGKEARDVIYRETHDATVEDILGWATWQPPSAALFGRRGGATIEAALEAGRLWWGERVPYVPLHRGDPIDVRLTWKAERERNVPSVVLPDDHFRLVRLVPAFLVDTVAHELHVADAGGGPARIDTWLAGPELADAQLAEIAPLLPTDLPKPTTRERVVLHPPLRARLHLNEQSLPDWVERRATLRLTYDDVPIRPHSTTNPILVRDPDRDREIWRTLPREAELLEALAAEGFHERYVTGAPEAQLFLWDEAAWIAFLLEGAQRLRDRGVEIEVDPSFKLEIVEIEDWYADLDQESENDWFGVDFGIQVKGERVSLLPLLVKAFDRPANRTAQTIVVELPGGKRARVPRERIEPLVDLIMELAASGGTSRPKISKLHAADLAHALRLENATLAALRALRETLVNASSIKLVAQPRKLKTKMRDYQRIGLSWLALLASHGLGGILADDMGLGKTVQVIALLCLFAQKRDERRPALVVAPRSVLVSWTDQLVAFAPHLDIRVWHGGDRRTWGTDFASMDLVVTTYQLLHRDIDILQNQRWSVVVLDEAQVIKNAKSVFATSAMKLDAGVRFALTGTPLENHLGELWSIVQFVAPGAFGNEKTFRAAFRNPIEKHGDTERLAALRRRLAPMLLRRTKEQVATELPPKTIITHRVDLDDAQRDLYEAVRQMMSKRIRDEIAKRGIAQARIVVLDALLKLRQVCCDPRLLKSKTAKAAAASAKLEAFEELLTTLVDEGRRVLVFSQFVEMLDLLEPVLTAHRISRARITGTTRDREGEVRRFQAGDVPVFLISLKAGGTGLNLTAADTVIHYDPWWNPAVEAQATDRAHRIGQDKPVFVHRLLTVGTIEEKIAALQEKKGALARGVLDGGGSVFDLDESTIDDLLAPLPR